MKNLKNELVQTLADNAALNKMLYLAVSDETTYAAKAIASSNDETMVMDIWEEIHNCGIVPLTDVQANIVLAAIVDATDPKYSPSNRGTTQNVKRYIDDLYEDLCGNPDLGEVVNTVGTVSNDFSGLYQDMTIITKIGMWEIVRSVIMPFITTPMVNGKPLVIPKNTKPTMSTAASSSFKKAVKEKIEKSSTESVLEKDVKGAEDVDSMPNFKEDVEEKLAGKAGAATSAKSASKDADDSQDATNASTEAKKESTDIIHINTDKSEKSTDFKTSIGIIIKEINKLKSIKDDERVFPNARKSVVDMVSAVISRLNRTDIVPEIHPNYPDGVAPSDVKYLAKSMIISEFAQPYLPPYIEQTVWGVNSIPFDDIGVRILVNQICEDVNPELIEYPWSKRSEIVNQVDWDELTIRTAIMLFVMDIPMRSFSEFIVDILIDDIDLNTLYDLEDIEKLSPDKLLDNYSSMILDYFEKYVGAKVAASGDDYVTEPFERCGSAMTSIAKSMNKFFKKTRII